MSNVPAIDDQSQSHYEISLTAGQAFVAFVLLLLSLAASFAFGLMIGKGQADERLIVRKEPAVVNEASVLPKKGDGKIVELGVSADDFKAAPPKTDSAAAATTTVPPATITEGSVTTLTSPATETQAAEAAALHGAALHRDPPKAVAPAVTGPVEAQLASIGDQKAAESLAARLINSGFTSAYVERGTNEKGTIWRVRVKFNSQADAQAALPRLKEFSSDTWITH